MIFDLERYIKDISTDHLRMENFIEYLMGSFKDREAADFWFGNILTPCWDNMLDEVFEEED